MRSWNGTAARGPTGPDDVSGLPAYVFDAGPLARSLFRDTDVLERLRGLLAPTPRLDALLDGLPSRLFDADHGGSAQFYAGPTGSGAPFHYHEHALNVLAHGRKTWWLAPPSDANYSVTHPAAWPREPGREKTPPLACVQKAGDVLFVPANWAHAVRNDAPSVGAALEFPDVFMIHHMNFHLVSRAADGDDDDDDNLNDEARALLADMIPGPPPES